MLARGQTHSASSIEGDPRRHPPSIRPTPGSSAKSATVSRTTKPLPGPTFAKANSTAPSSRTAPSSAAKEICRSKPSSRLNPAVVKPLGNKKHETVFSAMYARGEIPCRLNHGSVKHKLTWTSYSPPSALQHLLPSFFAGLLEKQHPYTLLSRLGIQQILASTGPSLPATSSSFSSTPAFSLNNSLSTLSISSQPSHYDSSPAPGAHHSTPRITPKLLNEIAPHLRAALCAKDTATVSAALDAFEALINVAKEDVFDIRIEEKPKPSTSFARSGAGSRTGRASASREAEHDGGEAGVAKGSTLLKAVIPPIAARVLDARIGEKCAGTLRTVEMCCGPRALAVLKASCPTYIPVFI
ncbi:uncharacterized protein EV422DRAFT_137467 [Fimicolochytrium jonesii]|uniref:uncharacterized protein n=1 Tax=Fimicolochytrium jonesii TaxID=1396493 RepID=UPI0022FE64F4|nr:uncharacterized protein EV422DRAFT_137467 [Fimicolochytrium jonesii]KAI8825709.1 hypothetical protein EV422DRAFT_137467 [Fimicolochytrium jonesii]